MAPPNHTLVVWFLFASSFACSFAPWGPVPPLLAQSTDAPSSVRTSIPLAEGWSIQKHHAAKQQTSKQSTSNPQATDQPATDQDPWTPIHVGDSWEPTLGYDFDGKATYRIELPSLPSTSPPRSNPTSPQDAARVLLEFQGVATLASLWVQEQKISEHVGAWTPWVIDITDWYRPGLEIQVQVDEAVGHNTQGFLPIFLPHFGGIWQTVTLHQVPASYIDPHRSFAGAYVDKHQLQIQATCRLPTHDQAEFGIALLDPSQPDTTPSSDAWTWSHDFHPSTRDPANQSIYDVALSIPLANPQAWSPQSPHRYRVRFAIRDRESHAILYQVDEFASCRLISANGTTLKLNGEGLRVRGVLHWGYAPPRIAPSLDPDWMKQEILAAKSMGFNLIKFCLWIPPQAYLDLCDEHGMLAWVEYPTWHPKLTPEFLPQLRREYQEFFDHDRNHPSVILRSLTCETGPSADLEVIRQLYQACHAAIPGSLVEDDSSWIGWNRIHDFYDDHPYGNNATWVQTLRGLKDHIAKHGPKPLLLGEAIAADTWWPATPLSNPNQSLDASTPTSTTPSATATSVHTLRSAPKQAAYVEQLKQWCGPKSVEAIAEDAARVALQVRKYQIETFAGVHPEQGYVISVLRDFPLASMGLIDFNNQLKWAPEDWSWQTRPNRLIGRDYARCFDASFIRASVDWGHRLTLKSRFGRAGNQTLQLSASVPVDSPLEPGTMEVENDRGETCYNWPIWLVGPPETWRVKQKVAPHPSFSKADTRWAAFALPPSNDPSTPLRIATRLDLETLDWVEQGGRLILLPDGSPGSFPLANHWFLRGGVVIADHPAIEDRFRTFLADLQPFDLSSQVIKSPDYLDDVRPLMLLWDNHDLDHYETHALAFLMGVGKGRILVSTLNHKPEPSPAGPYALARFTRLMLAEPNVPALPESRVQQLRADLSTTSTLLARDRWQFKPDPKNEGLTQGWMKPDHPRDDWSPIEIAQFWDGQGFRHVDGFAWYAKTLSFPSHAKFLTFTGVDDAFELYFNGTKIGSYGNRETKESTFDATVSIPIPDAYHDQQVVVVIRVDDWHGAGGIFRPVFLSNQPWPSSPPMLVRQQTEK